MIETKEQQSDQKDKKNLGKFNLNLRLKPIQTSDLLRSNEASPECSKFEDNNDNLKLGNSKSNIT